MRQKVPVVFPANAKKREARAACTETMENNRGGFFKVGARKEGVFLTFLWFFSEVWQERQILLDQRRNGD
jgi:hypothetical protein